MDIGVFVLDTGSAADPAVLAKRAEELGFASFWVPEHTIIPLHYTTPYRGDPNLEIPGGYYRMADPFITLSRAAGATTTIRLGTAVSLLPERNPLLLAKTIATLDQQSGGRVIYGLGVGWLKEETEIMGGDYPHRGTQAVEGIQALKELWTRDEAEYHGRYYDFPPVRLYPKPVQKPHPPIVFGGGRGPARDVVFRRIVGLSDGWLPVFAPVDTIREGRAALDKLAEERGRDPASIKIYAMGGEGRYRSQEEVRELEEAGADHVVLWMERTEGDEALAELEELAGELLSLCTVTFITTTAAACVPPWLEVSAAWTSSAG